MNKQEAIKKVEHAVAFSLKDILTEQQVDVVYKSEVLDIVSQIDEPEKPVIPQFVAEWIEYCKSNELTLLGAFDPVSEYGTGLANTFTGEVRKGVDWAKRNQEIFARAWLDGYEIEQEKLYTVEIQNPNDAQLMTVLKRFSSGKVIMCAVHRSNIHLFENKEFQFTESEIKQDFEWAWDAGFAKEIE